MPTGRLGNILSPRYEPQPSAAKVAISTSMRPRRCSGKGESGHHPRCSSGNRQRPTSSDEKSTAHGGSERPRTKVEQPSCPARHSPSSQRCAASIAFSGPLRASEVMPGSAEDRQGSAHRAGPAHPLAAALRRARLGASALFSRGEPTPPSARRVVPIFPASGMPPFSGRITRFGSAPKTRCLDRVAVYQR